MQVNAAVLQKKIVQVNVAVMQILMLVAHVMVKLQIQMNVYRKDIVFHYRM